MAKFCMVLRVNRVLYNFKVTCILCILICSLYPINSIKFSKEKLKFYRNRVSRMFHHAYDGYTSRAYPYDELRPISCDGVDSWGSFSLTLIDSLDTLAIMGNYSEFRKVANQIIEKQDFNININVSVFETNIRIVGGLISAHLLSKKAGMEVGPSWPCDGPLLRLAETVARKLLPAFQSSSTGMPYGTVNLMHGVPPGETPITCTAGIGTFILEFAALSRLTHDPVFERTAMKALWSLWKNRSPIGLVGNHINVQDGKWVALDSGIGAGVDSYFEYLVKGSIMLQNPVLLKMFNSYYKLINKYIKRDDWHLWVSMNSGQVSMPIFQSLEAFWPGVLSLMGELDQAQKTLYNYHQIWKQYGFMPEFYDITQKQLNSKREGYPLRPELIESIMYLYQATRDDRLLQMGVDILESIEHSAKTSCGYATIKNVQTHTIEDRMESFFLAETTKYLYLLFDTENFIHNNGNCQEILQEGCNYCTGSYIFNTEAHPIDLAALDCCHSPFNPSNQLLDTLIAKSSFKPNYVVPEHYDEHAFNMSDTKPNISATDSNTAPLNTEENESGEVKSEPEESTEDQIVISTVPKSLVENISIRETEKTKPFFIEIVPKVLDEKSNLTFKYSNLFCNALPYLSRISIMGEVFIQD